MVWTSVMMSHEVTFTVQLVPFVESVLIRTSAPPTSNAEEEKSPNYSPSPLSPASKGRGARGQGQPCVFVF